MIIKLYELEKPFSKEECIKHVSNLLVDNNITTPEYYEGILIRDKQASFNIGNFVAIPHAVTTYHKHIKNNGLIILRSKQPIEWDGSYVHYVIGIAAMGDKQIDVLSNIANSFCEEQAVLDSLNIDLNNLAQELKWE